MSGAGDGMGDIIGQASARDVEGNYKKVGDKKGPFVGVLRMDGRCQAACTGRGAARTGLQRGQTCSELRARAWGCTVGLHTWGYTRGHFALDARAPPLPLTTDALSLV